MNSLEMNNDILLQIRDLKVHFVLKREHIFDKRSFVHAVDGVSFAIRKGTTYGLVGESGSGKTTAALAAMRLTDITSGNVYFDGQDISNIVGEDLRLIRRRMQIIFQDPYLSLNPRLRAGAIVREPLDVMNVGNPKNREARVAEIFENVGLRPEQKALFPHQFSGGQRQRIGIARALATNPDLVVCDEPVSALDVAIQAQILNLLRKLQKEYGLTFVFISHDLGVVQYMCDEIAVMYLGQIVEKADRITLYKKPLHPYTQVLLSAVPSAKPKAKKKFGGRIRVKGDPPSPIDPPIGCRFAARCSSATTGCYSKDPKLLEVEAGHLVACHKYLS
jgi:peptide/nickel transport system ATP-binding protein